MSRLPLLTAANLGEGCRVLLTFLLRFILHFTPCVRSWGLYSTLLMLVRHHGVISTLLMLVRDHGVISTLLMLCGGRAVYSLVNG